jgi:two-component system sensor histidine kinase KdpD
MLFLAAVVASATLWGLMIALYTAALSFLCWNYFFIPPVGQLTIREPRDVIAILVFSGVAIATGLLASRVRDEAAAAQGRIESLRRISGFSRRLGAPAAEAELLAEIAGLAADIVSPAVVLMAEGEDLNIRAAVPASLDTMDDGSWAAARARHRHPAEFRLALPAPGHVPRAHGHPRRPPLVEPGPAGPAGAPHPGRPGSGGH